MIGKNFNSLHVVSLNKETNGRKYYLCLCLCGKETIVRKDSLLSGSTKSCGCLKNKVDSIKGNKYNRLSVIRYYGKNKFMQNIWLCKCDCGKITKVIYSKLINGRTKSCGCLKKDKTIERNTKYIFKVDTTFYNIWKHIKQRCNNTKNKSYKYYGGRGITYDPRWEDFLEFKKDMYMHYLYATKQLKIKKPSIERKDVNGNYCKENCTWIDSTFQSKNTRRQLWFMAISPNGDVTKTKHKTEFANTNNLFCSAINKCLKKKQKFHKGWSFEYIVM